MQDQGSCGACVGFALTAAAEAAVNVHQGSSWSSVELSESDLSFCRYGFPLNATLRAANLWVKQEFHTSHLVIVKDSNAAMERRCSTSCVTSECKYYLHICSTCQGPLGYKLDTACRCVACQGHISKHCGGLGSIQPHVTQVWNLSILLFWSCLQANTQDQLPGRLDV
jgi:hypothetical protein